MPGKFRIERFEPIAINKAQELLDHHLKEAQDVRVKFEIEEKEVKKKSFLEKLLAWFK